MEQVRSENLSHDEPPQETDIGELLNQCTDALRPLLEVRELTLRRSVPAGVRARVAVGRLRSVMMNLLGNAVEYNRPGGRVDLTCSACDGEWVIRVGDTGPGIAPEHLPHLFDPFYRADGSRRQEVGEDDPAGGQQHLGLGLSLVRAHVQAMGGTCAVESRVGQGSVFSVCVPVTTTPGGQPGPAPAGKESPGPKVVSHGGLIEAG